MDPYFKHRNHLLIFPWFCRRSLFHIEGKYDNIETQIGSYAAIVCTDVFVFNSVLMISEHIASFETSPLSFEF